MHFLISMPLNEIDPILANLLSLEIQRQRDSIDLIPSECVASPEVLSVLGSPLNNKYSEGEVAKRYYPGNQYIDQIEVLAKQRAKETFGLSDDWEVNVQALSGSPANLAVYFGLLKPGDKIMGMGLASGGHLSHGHLVNVSGKIFQQVKYGVGIDGFLDYNEIEEISQKEKPQIIVSGFTAYPRKIDFEKFGEIAKKIDAFHLADISHIAGLVASGLHMSPFPFCDVVMMTTHKTLNGPRGAVLFFKKELADRINRAVFPGLQGGPHNHQIGAIAIMFFLAQKPEFKEQQKQIIKNAKIMAEVLLGKGFKLSSGGTDNHLLLIDLKNKNISGKEAQDLLEEANILANKNSVPGDQSPVNPTGLRMGTPVITFRGMREKEAEKIALWLSQILSREVSPELINLQVKELCQKFPLPY